MEHESAAGRCPAVDHDGKQFLCSSYSGKLAGTALKVHGACDAKCGGCDWFK